MKLITYNLRYQSKKTDREPGCVVVVVQEEVETEQDAPLHLPPVNVRPDCSILPGPSRTDRASHLRLPRLSAHVQVRFFCLHINAIF